jgi:hypothetical protein
MPIGHISLATTPTSYKPMRDFYVATLAPLGYTLFEEKDGCYLGLQKNHDPDFWLHCCTDAGGADTLPLVDASLTADENRKLLGRGRTHVAFSVGSAKVVDEWYRNAV